MVVCSLINYLCLGDGRQFPLAIKATLIQLDIRLRPHLLGVEFNPVFHNMFEKVYLRSSKRASSRDVLNHL